MLKQLLVIPAVLAVAMAAPAFANPGNHEACGPACMMAKADACDPATCKNPDCDMKVANADHGDHHTDETLTYGLTGVKDKAGAAAVEKALDHVKGVHDAHVAADLKSVMVHEEVGHEVALADLNKALGKLGHLVEMPAKAHDDHHDHGDHHHDGPAHEGGDHHH